jgi:tetratricopeptide (TPR) repeat protein
MRPLLAALVCAGLVIGAVCSRSAAAQPQPPRRPPPKPLARPADASPAKPAPPLSGRPLWVYPPAYYPYWGAYPYYPTYVWPGYWYGPGYPLYVPYSGGSIILPPVWVPSDSLYGPEAVKRFMGGERSSAARGGALRPSPARDVPAEAKKPAAQRGTNAESIARARRFIALGDKMFGEGKYSDSYERYRMASQAAPGLADAYFRQGFALVASGRYETAAKALKRGLDLDANWPKSEFRLDSLYGAKGGDKRAQLDMLATAASQNPRDPDLLFLIGVFLHFDGQAERAKPFFERAAQLGGIEAKYLKAFDRPPGRQPADGPF